MKNPPKHDPKNFPLRRRAVVKRLLARRGNLLVVAGLGSCAWDVAAAGDSPRDFPLWGAMGGAVSIALGLALARPQERVLCITGDGEMLMGITALTTIATLKPQNLAIAVLDNETYGETGGQPTATRAGADLAAIAHGAGMADCATVATARNLPDAIKALRRAPGPVFRVIKVRFEELPLIMPPKDGALLRDRFRRALGLGEG